MIELKHVDMGNFDDVIGLTVAKEQETYVLPNVYSMAQAKVQPECEPLAVCVDGKPVGFLMYCLDRDDGEYWLYRLMVGAEHQGKGYGRAAMMLLLDQLRRDETHSKILLDVHKESTSAVKLYESMGFVFTGKVYGGSHVMELVYR